MIVCAETETNALPKRTVNPIICSLESQFDQCFKVPYQKHTMHPQYMLQTAI